MRMGGLQASAVVCGKVEHDASDVGFNKDDKVLQAAISSLIKEQFPQP